MLNLEPFEQALIMRRRLGISQKQAAAAVPLHWVTVVEIENGRGGALAVNAYLRTVKEIYGYRFGDKAEQGHGGAALQQHGNTQDNDAGNTAQGVAGAGQPAAGRG